MLQKVTIKWQREAKGSDEMEKWGGAKFDGMGGGLHALKGGDGGAPDHQPQKFFLTRTHAEPTSFASTVW